MKKVFEIKQAFRISYKPWVSDQISIEASHCYSCFSDPSKLADLLLASTFDDGQYYQFINISNV